MVPTRGGTRLAACIAHPVPRSPPSAPQLCVRAEGPGPVAARFICSVLGETTWQSTVQLCLSPIAAGIQLQGSGQDAKVPNCRVGGNFDQESVLTNSFPP